MDLSFLDQPMPRLKQPRGVINLYDVLEQAGLELAADRTLAYFFAPEERHGMGTAMLDAFLKLVDGAPLLGAEGRLPDVFDSSPTMKSSGWTVDRQVTAPTPSESQGELGWQGFIDLYLTNRDLDIAIIIENKIGASLANPLESYVRHAVDEGYGTVLLAVLAPYEHPLDEKTSRWTSRAVTYSGLFQAMRTASATPPPGASDTNQRRSADLLEQFQEIRERTGHAVDYAIEAEFVGQFRETLEGHASALKDFFDAQQKINKLYRQRSERLGPLIDERLLLAGLEKNWESHSYNTNTWTYAWNAYRLTESDNSVELILSPDPKYAGAITAKAYPGRSYKLYPGLDHVTLGVDWINTDEEIADAFVALTIRVASEHPQGS
jgi:hypothetical protein